MSDARFELFSFWRTSATYRVRVALNVKGIVAREHDIDIDAGANRSDDFLRINPMGALPALVDHEGKSRDGDVSQQRHRPPLTQSLAILEFLEELQPQPPLLPADLHARARVRSLATLLAADTHPFIVPRVRKYLATHAGFDPAAWKAWQTHWITTGLQAYETRLVSEAGTGRFSHGEAVTIADICLASIVVVVRVFGVEVASVPTIDRIVAACEGLEAFAQADPRRQMGAPAAAGG